MLSWSECLCRNQAPSAFGAKLLRMESASWRMNILSSKIPAACTMMRKGPALRLRTRSSRDSTCFSLDVSHCSWMILAPVPMSASSRSAKPWPSLATPPEREQSTTVRTPASTKASAVTMPSPPRPPVTTATPFSEPHRNLGAGWPARSRFRAERRIRGQNRTPPRYATSMVPSVASSSQAICCASSAVFAEPPKPPKASESKRWTGIIGSSIFATRTTPRMAAAADGFSKPGSMGPEAPQVSSITEM
mmetsp:Transcript_91425/g.295788  ORF Transcript_91425/g.295788 Transcript_91425/m.295788 type:complete len:248 (+) Transcript_91425:595-1338(+)